MDTMQLEQQVGKHKPLQRNRTMHPSLINDPRMIYSAALLPNVILQEFTAKESFRTNGCTLALVS